MNKGIEEAINSIKELIEGFYNFPNPQSVSMPDYKIKDIETVLKELERLQEENKQYNRQLDLDYVRKNYIARDKIREEIKQLQDMKVEGEVFTTSKNFAIKTLQEVLEGK